MTESRATKLRSAPNFEEMEISTRRIAHKRPFCAVLGFFFTEINFTTNFAVFFATNTAVFNVVFNYVSSTPKVGLQAPLGTRRGTKFWGHGDRGA